MALQTIWHYTNIPKDIVDIIEKDLFENYEDKMQESRIISNIETDRKKRNSKNAWISSNHWITGFLWFYLDKSNKENFQYDITGIDNENLQYTKYQEGEYYNWHADSSIGIWNKPKTINESKEFVLENFISSNTERIRKLSFILQLSDPDDYEGGNLQIMAEDHSTVVAPRQRGTIIVFDSRTPHRVCKIRSGCRRSVVGWAIGPRWK